ncbi:MAG: hypothetical protein P4L84_11225 [Isosphaeraceae bacterium]|nr:hypothetical protein [Isosphaeraceae bacterium]
MVIHELDSTVIERRTIPTTGDVVEVNEIDTGQCYAEQIKQVQYGMASRVTRLYSSTRDYYAADRAGQLEWGKWM